MATTKQKIAAKKILAWTLAIFGILVIASQVFPLSKSYLQGEYIKTRQPHSDVKYALDMVYKLKGLYKGNEFSVSINNPTDSMSMEELDEAIENLEKQCRYEYIKEKRSHS